ncbi:MAG: glycine cleavage system protein GcvH [Alphaproteobacteria bacterium]|nr:MAG: glycine cleavage system protein GcvH [Alphaproteobacteria bacterium]
MSDIRYSEDHEWIILDGDVGTIGISDYAQGALGDVVFVEMPEIGASLDKGAEVGVIESVKAASEIYTPVSGEIVAVNEAVDGDPSLVNTDPLGEGWLFKIKLSKPEELNGLSNQDAYNKFLEGLD